MGLLEKFKLGLNKSSSSLSEGITNIFKKRKIDQNLLQEFEDLLISSDVGIETAQNLKNDFEKFRVDKKLNDHKEILKLLADKLSLDLLKYEKNLNDLGNNKSAVIVVSGVNGVGKTTTIGKLAHKFKKAGKKVVLGASDTFRAAAVDQLVIWSERVGVDIVKQDMGSDPASVAFDTLQSAKANKADVVIIDTAGRLHNNVNLMRELGKIRNVLHKVIPEAPHDVMLILDASTGQNAIEQATQFTAATEVNSLALTKLDGTAKGGVVIGISDQFQIPVRYIGVGEGMEDLQQFNKTEFVDSLFN